jgi:hypothetical protein
VYFGKVWIGFMQSFQHHLAITTDQMIHLPISKHSIAAYFDLIDPVKIDIFSTFTVAYYKHVYIY